MARKYRKISPNIWNDAKVRELSDRGKLAFLFLLTHPATTPFGAIRGNVPGLAFELGWSAKALGKALSELLDKGMARMDEKACLIWFPNFLKYNLPESPNVVKSWPVPFFDLPECELREVIRKALSDLSQCLGDAYQKAFQEAFAEACADILEAFGEAFQEGSGEGLSEGYRETFREGFAEGSGKGMPNQEQEQEQEQELNTPPYPPEGGAGTGKGEKPHSSPPPENPQEPGMEFMQLRADWDAQMRLEGPLAGFKAYQALKKARAWPGLAAIRGDVQKRKQAGVWNPGYEPGLEKYLSERVWLAALPKTRAAPKARREMTLAEKNMNTARQVLAEMEREEREAQNANV